MTKETTTSLELSGSCWALETSLNKLRKAAYGETSGGKSLSLVTFRLNDFDLDVSAAAAVVQLVRKHESTLKFVTLQECTGHTDIVLTVALTIPIKCCSLSLGRLATAASSPCMHALGVGLQISHSLRDLILQAGSNVFFTLDSHAARSLEQGLGNNSSLESFTLKCCRFGDPSAVRLLAQGLRRNGNLRYVTIRSCFVENGHALDDLSLGTLIQALELNTKLTTLDVSGNKCLDRGMAALATLLDRTHMQKLDISSQCIERDESMNISMLVASLGRTTSLQRLDLRFNKLNDEDMAYLAAALSHNESIRFLGLASNQIGNVGLSILASKVPQFRGLSQLVLTNNLFDADGASELAVAMQSNLQLGVVECDFRIPNTRIIQYYADLNWAGRKYLSETTPKLISLPSSLWPFVIQRVNRLTRKDNGIERCANVLYFLLREGPALFPR